MKDFVVVNIVIVKISNIMIKNYIYIRSIFRLEV